jgi:hypothetical protein
VHELHEIDGALALKFDCVDFFGLEEHVGVGVHFVALGNVGVLDRPDALHDLLIIHPPSGRLVDLAERDFRFRLDRVVEMHADRDDAQADEAFPVRAWTRHVTQDLEVGGTTLCNMLSSMCMRNTNVRPPEMAPTRSVSSAMAWHTKSLNSFSG